MRLSGRSARFLVERGMHAPPLRTRIGASSLRQDYGDQGCRSMGGNGAREAAVQRRPVAAPSTRQLFLTFVYSATSPLSPLPLVQRIPARPLSVSTVRSWRDRTCARACAHSTRRGNVRGCVKRSNGRGIFVSFIPFDST